MSRLFAHKNDRKLGIRMSKVSPIRYLHTRYFKAPYHPIPSNNTYKKAIKAKGKLPMS